MMDIRDLHDGFIIGSKLDRLRVMLPVLFHVKLFQLLLEKDSGGISVKHLREHPGSCLIHTEISR
jgi:hypothetical protein